MIIDDLINYLIELYCENAECDHCDEVKKAEIRDYFRLLIILLFLILVQIIIYKWKIPFHYAIWIILIVGFSGYRMILKSIKIINGEEDITLQWNYLIYIVLFFVAIWTIMAIDPSISGFLLALIVIANLIYMFIQLCVPSCTAIQEKDKCNSIGEICSIDTTKSDSECGSCSNSEKVTEEDCSGETEGEKEVWTSQMSSCYWVEPQEGVSGAPEVSCIYDLNKCTQIDCNTFEATYLFGDCCMPDNWEKWMDEKTLKIIQEQNKKDGSVDTADLAAEYNLRKASSEEYSRREEIEQGLYA